MHTSYMLLVYYLPNLLDLTHHIWCLGFDTDPVPEGNTLLEASLADEYRWGPANLEEPDNGVAVLGV